MRCFEIATKVYQIKYYIFHSFVRSVIFEIEQSLEHMKQKVSSYDNLSIVIDVLENMHFLFFYFYFIIYTIFFLHKHNIQIKCGIFWPYIYLKKQALFIV